MQLATLFVSIFISILFIISGIVKIVMSYHHPDRRIENFPETNVSTLRIISWIEIFGAILFFVPYYINVLPLISTFAGVTLIIMVIGAPLTHLKLGEHKEAALTTVLIIIIVIVIFSRHFL
jgi:membrane-associated HD superfamily phosphohydrolase